MNTLIDKLTDALADQNKAISELTAALKEWQAFLEETIGMRDGEA